MNNDDGYEYVFTDKDAIKLREGSYTLTLGGDFLALPYKVKSGNTVTVKGDVYKRQVRRCWCFTSKRPF